MSLVLSEVEVDCGFDDMAAESTDDEVCCRVVMGEPSPSSPDNLDVDKGLEGGILGGCSTNERTCCCWRVEMCAMLRAATTLLCGRRRRISPYLVCRAALP